MRIKKDTTIGIDDRAVQDFVKKNEQQLAFAAINRTTLEAAVGAAEKIIAAEKKTGKTLTEADILEATSRAGAPEGLGAALVYAYYATKFPEHAELAAKQPASAYASQFAALAGAEGAEKGPLPTSAVFLGVVSHDVPAKLAAALTEFIAPTTDTGKSVADVLGPIERKSVDSAGLSLWNGKRVLTFEVKKGKLQAITLKELTGTGLSQGKKVELGAFSENALRTLADQAVSAALLLPAMPTVPPKPENPIQAAVWEKARGSAQKNWERENGPALEALEVVQSTLAGAARARRDEILDAKKRTTPEFRAALQAYIEAARPTVDSASGVASALRSHLPHQKPVYFSWDYHSPTRPADPVAELHRFIWEPAVTTRVEGKKPLGIISEYDALPSGEPLRIFYDRSRLAAASRRAQFDELPPRLPGSPDKVYFPNLSDRNFVLNLAESEPKKPKKPSSR